MEISIRNYRGMASAYLQHSRLTLICGDNHAGKSSISEPLAACLTGDTIPRLDLTKTALKTVVRDGQKNAGIVVKVDLPGPSYSELRLNLPENKREATGPVVRPISLIAAGQVSLLDIKTKDRGPLLGDYLKASPTPEEVEKELQGAGFTPAAVKSILESIKISGWDASFGRVKEKGTNLKGQWEAVTGIRYGSDLSENWYPGKLYSALAEKSEADLQAAQAAAQKELEAGIRSNALAEMDLAVMKDQAALVPSLHAVLAGQETNITHQRRTETELQTKLLALTSQAKELSCPGCGAVLIVKNGALVHAPTEGADNKVEITQTQTDLNAVRNKIRALTEDLSQKRQELKQYMESAKKLEEVGDGAGQSVDLEPLRAAVLQADTDLKAWQDKKRADSLNAQVKLNKAAQDFLAPGGFRQVKINRALDTFNFQLAELSNHVKWPAVRIDTDYNIWYGGRPVNMLSREESFEVRALLQLVLAKIEGALTVIIDDADTMVHKDTRNAFFKAILQNGVPAVVCMAMKDRAEMPDLSRMPGGRSYWIEKGVVCETDAKTA